MEIEKWYFKKKNIVLGFILVGPLTLPLVWFHPRMSRAAKVGITALSLALTWLSVILLDPLLKSLIQSTKTLF